MAQQVQIQRKLRTKPSNDKCSSIEMANSTKKIEIFWLSYVSVTMCESMDLSQNFTSPGIPPGE